MDKVLVSAVAGSGKTQMIIDELDLNSKIAIITYTNANQLALCKKIEDKFNCMPNNIHVFGYWEFLYGFCTVPLLNVDARGIIYDEEIQHRILKANHYALLGMFRGYFLSKTFARCVIKSKIDYLGRIDKFFDKLFVDEVQDFSSDDLDWILSLSNLKIPVKLVGDFYQKTYATSHRGNKGKSTFLTEKNWITSFTTHNFKSDHTSLSKSWRCTPEICNFVRDNIGIKIYSAKSSKHSHIKLLKDPTDIEEMLVNDNITKLFLRSANKYKCKSMTWGKSKGLTFDNICVVLNSTTYKLYNKGKLEDLASQTKAKFYVACTRTAGDLFFIPQTLVPEEFKI